MKILLSNPRGFCAGVKRAMNTIEYAIKEYNKQIYIYHEIVHNDHIINNLKKRNINFIHNISSIPNNSILILPAHGVTRDTLKSIKKRKSLITFDATCPIVAKIYSKIKQASNNSKNVIIIGDPKHQEIKNAISQYNNPNGKIYTLKSYDDIEKFSFTKNNNNFCFFTQTTMFTKNVERIILKLYKYFPKITGSKKGNICYATINRQNAILNILNKAQSIIVIGSSSSSNSNRLVDVAKYFGKYAILVDSYKQIPNEYISNKSCIGIAAGASTPNMLIEQITSKLKRQTNGLIIEVPGIKEKVKFKIPKPILS